MHKDVGNKPATSAEVRQLGNKDEKGDITPRVYASSGPNRRTRRAYAKYTESKHNNRKTTKSRKTQRIELERAVVTKDQRVVLVKTGVFRSLRIIKNYLTGGFRKPR